MEALWPLGLVGKRVATGVDAGFKTVCDQDFSNTFSVHPAGSG